MDLWMMWTSRGVEGVGVKEFFGSDGLSRPSSAPDTPSLASAPVSANEVDIPRTALARIAVYDSLAAAPRVEDVAATDSRDFIEQVARQSYHAARDQGGVIPYTLIREIVENFIHARFAEVVVSIMDNGNTIRFSDQGPGIPDKERCFEPGFSTATSSMKRVIRGVGSGLPIVREYLSVSEGAISVEDNLGRGTVVTLRVDSPRPEPPAPDPEPEEALPVKQRLTLRQKQVLSLVMELGSVGPSAVSTELKVSPSTAYRDLASLEEAGLVITDEAGKRELTEEGIRLLDDLFK
jgi:DNA-binding transcriptional ArsR family regulator